MAAHLPVPKEGAFDICLDIVIKRSQSKKVKAYGDYVTFVGFATAFDFLAYGSRDTYILPVRVVRFPLENGSYECIVTNLPSNEFSTEDIKRLYFTRWGLKPLFASLNMPLALPVFTHTRQNLSSRRFGQR